MIDFGQTGLILGRNLPFDRLPILIVKKCSGKEAFVVTEYFVGLQNTIYERAGC